MTVELICDLSLTAVVSALPEINKGDSVCYHKHTDLSPSEEYMDCPYILK